jgi:hypothetical protein
LHISENGGIPSIPLIAFLAVKQCNYICVHSGLLITGIDPYRGDLHHWNRLCRKDTRTQCC